MRPATMVEVVEVAQTLASRDDLDEAQRWAAFEQRFGLRDDAEVIPDAAPSWYTPAESTAWASGWMAGHVRASQA